MSLDVELAENYNGNGFVLFVANDERYFESMDEYAMILRISRPEI